MNTSLQRRDGCIPGRILRAALFGLAVFISFTAGATHFRYGNMSWKRDLSYSGQGYKIDFTITESWRRGFAWSGYGTQAFGANGLPDPGEQIKFYGNFPIVWGDGSTPQQVTLDVTSVIPTSAIPAEDIVNGVFNVSHIYQSTAAVPVPTSYTAYFEGAARLNAGTGPTFLQNNGGGSFRVESKITVGNNNDAPVSTLPPVVNMVKGANSLAPNATYQIPATDPNGDVITFSLAPSASFTQTSNTPNTQPFQSTPGKFTVSPTGLISFETYNLTIGAQYNAVIRLTDSKGGYVHLDIIVRITGPSNAPVFDYSAGNTPANNITYTIPIGQNLSFNVRATDPDAADAVTLFGVGIPVGATLSPSLPVTGPVNGAAVTAFSWTPTASQVGSNVISFIAQDPQGVQTSTTVNVIVTCAVNFTTSVVDVTCNVPGSITVNASGGTGPYTFSVDGGSNFVSGSSPYMFGGLVPGTYPVQVKEANGCVVENTTTVVNIPDNTPPTITCPASISVNTGTNICGAVVTYAEPGVTDNCSVCGVTSLPGYSFLGKYNGHSYFISNNTGQWAAFKTAAESLGGHLATITSAGESAFLESSTSTLAWIGLSDEAVEGTFTWVTGEPVSYTDWCTNEPNNGSGNEDWVLMNWNCGGGGKGWNDGSNNALFPANAIVEFDCGATRTGGLASGSTFPVGTTNVTYVATDNSGNSSSCGFSVTVTDNQNPVITTNGNKNVNTDPGVCTASVSVSASATDNCSVGNPAGVRSDSQPLTAVYPVGTTTITWTVTDINGNLSTVVQTVVVTDNQKPVITTNGNKNVNTDANTCGAMVVVSANATDNCTVGTPIGVRSDAQALNALYPVGTTTITWNVTDANGVAADAVVQTVIVTDNQLPVLTAPANITTVANAGVCYATVNLGSATAADNCGLLPVTNNAPANGQYPVGMTMITYTVYDVNGNMSTATQTITVTDNQNPTIVPPANVSVSTDAGQCSATGVSLGNPTVSDNCGVLSYFNNAPTTFLKGMTTVTWTVTDVNGRTATANQTVTVTDNELPTITAPPAITTTTSHDGTGNCTTTYNIGFPAVGDNCGIFSVAAAVNGFIISPTSYPFPIGTTTVRWEILDNSFNFAFVNQTVTVTDDEAPTLSGVPANVTVSCNAVPAVGSPTASDNCTAAPTVTYLGQTSTQGSNPANANYYNYAITRTWKAMDASGNTSAIGMQVITVQDVSAPVITASSIPANVTVSCSSVPAAGMPSATDNCDAAPTVMYLGQTSTQGNSQTASNYYNYTITRTWKAKDATGNMSAVVSQVITVQDVVAPSFTRPANITIYTTTTCSYNATPAVTGTATNVLDNCQTTGLQATYTDVATPTCQGSFSIARTWKLMDASGNTAANQVQTITVSDNIAPTFTRPADITIYTGAACAYNAMPAATGDVINEADNCSSGLQATYTDVLVSNTTTGGKVITRTWKLVDNCGNMAANQTQTITVLDNTPPVLTCAANVTDCDNFNGNSKTLTLGVTDNCSATTTAWAMTGATAATGTGNSITKSFNVGSSTIVWTVKDASNNTSTCTTTVTIRTAPVASISSSNADAFCNAVELTGSGTPAGTYSYAWSYNNAAYASTQTIRLKVANGDGNYKLVVSDANGCPSQPVYYNLQKQTLAAMYVLIGMREVELAQSNDVFNGSVGVTSSYGEAEFDKYCSVASTGAFVKAYDIDVKTPVNIPNKIFSPAAITFPTMLLNTSSTSGLSNYTMTTSGTVTGNKKDLTINSGKTVTITGNVFEDVRINHDAVVTFTASDISMESLEMEYGAKIIFTGNTSMRVKDEVDIDKGCTVNPTGKKVTFYVKDPSSSSHNHNCYSSWSSWHGGNHTDEKFIVDGKGTNIIANVYMPGGKLRVHGNGYSCGWSSGDECNMTGLFIAEEIEGDGKNINWSSYDCSMPPSCRAIGGVVALQEEGAADYKVLVYPNPTTGQFTVQFADVTTAAELRITDIQGRLVSQRSIPLAEMPSTTIDISGQAAGVYMVEVQQSGYTQRLRMVKQ